ncbi:hypothetical protein IWW57_006660 [Coemansia sp. S610]|nr:hypothetical protein IWW57_006660 [Coemansia sp. S610]
MSHNRVSFISSSCSTVVSDSSVKQSRARVRRPTAFMSNDDSAAGNAAEQPKSAVRSSGATGSSHCSLVALYEDASPIGSAGLNPSLVSLAAPPQLTLVQAEATAARGRTSTNNGTLCSLCHGDFTIQDSQHQCTSCLSLVCSRCINHQQPTVGKNKLSSRSSDSPKPNFSRILSMYIPEGYEHQPGDTVCNSCATFSSECKSGDKRQRAGVPLALSTRI